MAGRERLFMEWCREEKCFQFTVFTWLRSRVRVVANDGVGGLLRASISEETAQYGR